VKALAAAFALQLTCALTGLGQMPPSRALPAQGGTSVALSLHDAEALALKNHPHILAAEDQYSAAVQRVRENKSAYYPTIDGEITGSQGYDLTRIGAGALAASVLFNREGQGLQVGQLITDFGRRRNLVGQSELQARAFDQNVQATRYDVVLGVDRAYYGVLAAQAVVKVAEQTVAARQTVVDQVTALFKSQLKSQVDVSFADVSLSQAKLLLVRAQGDVQTALADLSRALGEDTPRNYTVTESPEAPAPRSDPNALVAEALQNRPELRALQFDTQAARRFEAAERDLNRPTITFLGVGGALPYINTTTRVPHEYEGAGINVNIPIFNGFLFTARREEAHYQVLATDQRRRDLAQQISHDVRTALLSAATAYQRIPVAQQLLAQAQLALDLAQGRYNLGLSSIVDVTQAQLSLTQAQIENLSAKYEYQAQYAALQYTIGALR